MSNAGTRQTTRFGKFMFHDIPNYIGSRSQLSVTVDRFGEFVLGDDSSELTRIDDYTHI